MAVFFVVARFLVDLRAVVRLIVRFLVDFFATFRLVVRFLVDLLATFRLVVRFLVDLLAAFLFVVRFLVDLLAVFRVAVLRPPDADFDVDLLATISTGSCFWSRVLSCLGSFRSGTRTSETTCRWTSDLIGNK